VKLKYKKLLEAIADRKHKIIMIKFNRKDFYTFIKKEKKSN